MKRLLAVILASALVLSGCARQTTGTPSFTFPSTIESTVKVPTSETSERKIGEPNSTATTKVKDPTITVASAHIPKFNDFGDPKLLQYVQDSVYAGLVDQFSSEDYIIENVSAIYYSKEYLEELDYNSKANIFFGYTLQELDEQFQGTRYVFTLSGEGETTVQPFEDYDDTTGQAIKSIAIDTGIFLVYVTISVVYGEGVASAVSMILATSVKAETTDTKSADDLRGLALGAIKYIKDDDLEMVVKRVAHYGLDILIESLFDTMQKKK